MSDLNPEQYAAITSIDSPLLVIAGAGSGKTRVITKKIAYLIEQCQFSPRQIYAVTFTNKAAKEMAERTHKLLKKKRGKDNPHISTFHALGLNFLKREAAHLNLNTNFTLFDTLDAQNLLKELSGKITAVSDDSVKLIHQSLSNWKNALITPAQALSQSNSEQEHLAARFYAAYETTLHAFNAVDFDDLILLPVTLLQDNAEVREKWQNMIRYLLIDEYQDTNAAQYQLIKLLCGIRQAFTVVGDDDQSIYAWRGAKPENLQLLQQDYPTLQVIKLEQNYRSTDTILQAANALISNNPHLFEKKLWSTLGTGEPIRIVATQNDEDEIERVVRELVAHQFRHRLTYSDYAILYRSNHQARPLEQALREQGIPYQISGGQSFFSRTEVKDVFAYFRLMINPDDDAAFLRCVNTPKRDIGPTTLEKLGGYARQRNCSLFQACSEMGLSEWLPDTACNRLQHFSQTILEIQEEALNADNCLPIIETFVEEIGYYAHLSESAPNAVSAQKRIDNVRDLLKWLGHLVNPLGQDPHSFQEAIQKITLIDILDRQSAEQNTNCVQLMTLHAAKGLEFPHVFILGWEEECLPHKNSIEIDMINEERRLAYVGMTRAKRSLMLTYTKQRKRYGEWAPTTPSRFLEEIPSDFVVWEGNAEPLTEEQQRASGESHLSALKALLQNP
jgi:ATP-dependent DNA helicase Rep